VHLPAEQILLTTASGRSHGFGLRKLSDSCIPTGIALSEFLPSMRVIYQVHEDFGVVLQRFGPLGFIVGGHELLDLRGVLLFKL